MKKETIKKTVKQKASIGRKCSVCTHKNSNQINKLIAEGASFRVVSRRFFGSESAHDSVRRHTENCLKIDIHAVAEQKKQEQVFNFHETIKTLLTQTNKMAVSLEKWLADPDNENEFDISPRDDEMVVVYLDYSDCNKQGEPRRKKDTLSSLLRRAESGLNIQSIGVQSNAMDNRKLYLETIKVFADRLDQYFKYFAPPKDQKSTDEEIAKSLVNKFSTEHGWTIDETIEGIKLIYPRVDVSKLLEAKNS